jgi:hypothetical protein
MHHDLTATGYPDYGHALQCPRCGAKHPTCHRIRHTRAYALGNPVHQGRSPGIGRRHKTPPESGGDNERSLDNMKP